MPLGAASRSLDGGPHCGDQWGFWQSGEKVTLLMVDGLGHGKYAEKAAHAAVSYVGCHLSGPIEEIFSGCDRALRHTWGVAMGLGVVDAREGKLTFGGVGNTRAICAGKTTVALTSSYGIVGAGYKVLVPATVPLAPGDLVVLFTDGLAESVDLSRYGEPLRADVQRLAERILEDWSRGIDDAAVIVFRHEVP